MRVGEGVKGLGETVGKGGLQVGNLLRTNWGVKNLGT